MGETCGICERPKGDPHRYPVAGECTAPDSTDYTVSLQCISIALRKAQEALAATNARADAAVAEIVNEQRRFGEVQAEAWKLEEALAAARRECEEQRKAKEAAYAKIYQTLAMLDRLPDGTVARDVRAALAAPAASEEKSNG